MEGENEEDSVVGMTDRKVKREKVDSNHKFENVCGRKKERGVQERGEGR